MAYKIKNFKEPIKECAIALKGDDEVFKIEDYCQWLENGDKDDVTILEDCDKGWLEEKYLYWEHTINYKKYAI